MSDEVTNVFPFPTAATRRNVPLPISAQESRARRAAHRCGLLACKSRWRRGTIDNFGGFQIIDPWRNTIVAGERFDLDAEDVVTFCDGGD
jgi:hypothetical protein